MRHDLFLSRALIFLALGFGLWHCSASKTQTDPKAMMLNASTNDDYDALWRQVDSLRDEGLPESALDVLRLIRQKAEAEANDTQFLKASITQGALASELQEDGKELELARLRAEMEAAAFPRRAILQAVLARLYHDYFQANYWRLAQRSDLAADAGEDIRTWPTERFYEEIDGLYLAALSDPRSQDIPVDAVGLLLENPNINSELRPTLYDVLLDMAMQHFLSGHSGISQPAYKFELDRPEYFAPAAEFAALALSSPDSSASSFRTLQIFQRAMRFHLAGGDFSPALMDYDLKRIQYAYQQSPLADKDEHYKKALENARRAYREFPAAAEAAALLAQYHMAQGRSYDPLYERGDKMALQRAMDLCEATIRDYDGAYGAIMCHNLKAELEMQELELLGTAYLSSQDNWLIGLRYRNVPKAHFRLVRISAEEAENINTNNFDDGDAYQMLLGKTPLAEWSQVLPNEGYHQHSTEIAIEKQAIGTYALLANEAADFQGKQFRLLHVAQVTDLALMRQDATEENSSFFVVNRHSGAPLAAVRATFWHQEHDGRRGRYRWVQMGETKSDAEGRFKGLWKHGYRVKLERGEDVLFPEQYFYERSEDKPSKHTRTHFFLDRRIYRPGQTVYFKALVLQYDEKSRPNILANTSVDISFLDANYQVVETQQLKTNAFGSVSGSFRAPEGGLRGQMHLRSSLNGETLFRVEEYRRPKFEVKMDAPKGNYRLGEEVRLKGQAKSFAGSSVDDAEVRYRIVREVRWPYWRGWYWGPQPHSESMEIANGTLRSAADGSFDIAFTALPDRSIEPAQKPVFVYRLEVDVTDNGGETQSQQSRVEVGYQALQIHIDAPQKAERSSLRRIGIAAKNMAGEAIATQLDLRLERLQTPERSFLPRPHTRPSKYSLSKAAFERLFPHFAYANEDEAETWPAAAEILRQRFDSGQASELDLPELQTGVYRLTASGQDAFGQAVEQSQLLWVYDRKGSEVPGRRAEFEAAQGSSYRVGESVHTYYGSAFPDVQVLYTLEHQGKIIEQKWVKSKGLHDFAAQVPAEWQGGAQQHFLFVHHNTLFGHSQALDVPWDSKKLHISYERFRDKLYPGEQEEWRIRISGPDKDKVAAEAVAALYDASLDQFVSNNFEQRFFPTYGSRIWQSGAAFGGRSTRNYGQGSPINYRGLPQRSYPLLSIFGFNMHGYHYMRFDAMASDDGVALEEVVVSAGAPRRREDAPMPMAAPPPAPAAEAEMEKSINIPDSAIVGPPQNGQAEGQVRSNLNETVFFMPELKTDANGDILLSFKMNEALTRWKFLLFAHSRDMQTASSQRELLTQKELMVMPNAPRFFRQGDRITFTASVSNLSTETLRGQARLSLFDAADEAPLDSRFGLVQPDVPFEIEPGRSAAVSWTLSVPKDFTGALGHRVVARAGNFSDGEASATPVLPNRMMVTETMPMALRSGQKRLFSFAAMSERLASGSQSLQPHSLTIEFTSNPAWYAVQAMPYLMEYPHECSEQLFNRFYANSLGSSLMEAHPKIREVFDKWQGTAAMESNLRKNQELKAALLEETPWVMAAQSEEQQRRDIALLFDLNRMGKEQASALMKLQQRQMPNGGFAWFEGGEASWYITQYIVEGLGHLRQLGAFDPKANGEAAQMLNAAITFIDQEFLNNYQELAKQVAAGKTKWEDDHLGYMAIHYLYARSFFPQKAEGELGKAQAYYREQARTYWLQKDLYAQGLIALALHRSGDGEKAQGIVRSLRERALKSEEMGMYWNYSWGYYWYQLPIETQALMIEVFSEVAKDAASVDELRIWLLKNKQTNRWETTKGTAAAVYALLMNGSNWLADSEQVRIAFPASPQAERLLAPIRAAQAQAEPGTGYFKYRSEAAADMKSMAAIEIENPNAMPAWGAMYWQYFEDLDKITHFKDTPLSMSKTLYVERPGDRGPELQALADGARLVPGDKVVVRIVLRSDRDMEFVHLKDMRAAGFEPINVLSRYRWQDGLGYYESTRDVATDFFIDFLPKGTYVFEYPLRVRHRGDFSNGISSIQCMYAPEFSSHSEGIRVRVE